MTGPVWTKERAWAWYDALGQLQGFNYLPRTVINDTEMWQAETFDITTTEQELGWASRFNYNSVRVFLQYLVWADDPDGFKGRLERFLTVAADRGVSVMPILFDDCAFAGREPYLGKQDEPVPGVHNSGWVPSPGSERVKDRSVWPELERYVKDIVGSFAEDKRIVVWDLYNEPGNANMGEKSLPLVEAAFAWAREVGPMQPLTVGPWVDFGSSMSQRLFALSDVISFHTYEDPAGVREKLELCGAYERPLLCTEWLHRPRGNTFAAILPQFEAYNVGWYHWGLVAGRTQTYMPWGSKLGDPMPELWQHDVLHPDGSLYDAAELDLLSKNHRRSQPSVKED